MSDLKAYSVVENNEMQGAIVFAKSNVEARRYGANEYNDGEFAGMTVKRAPWADDYSDEPIPASLMIDHGWNFECTYTGKTIDLDTLSEEGFTSDDVVGTQHSLVFMCQDYKDKWDADQKKIDKENAKLRKRMMKYARQKFGKDVFFEDDDPEYPTSYTYSNIINGVPVAFSGRVDAFHPDMKGSIQIRWDRKEGFTQYCLPTDMDALHRLAEKNKPWWKKLVHMIKESDPL